MKKTVTLPDGTTEVLEGTPEEIAEHEKLIRERTETPAKKKKKPGLLQGAPPDMVTIGTEPVKFDPEVIKKLQELIDATKENKQVVPQPACWYCGVVGCRNVHDNPWPQPTVIYGTATIASNTTCAIPRDAVFIPERDGGLIVS